MVINALKSIRDKIDHEFDTRLKGKNNSYEILEEAKFVYQDLSLVLEYVVKLFPKNLNIFEVFE